MRWSTWVISPLFTSRVKSRFLLTPLCLDGECRWLERAEWVETFYGEAGWIKSHWGNQLPPSLAPRVREIEKEDSSDD